MKITKIDNGEEVRIGNIFGATGGNHAGMVYDKYGLGPTLLAMRGGYRQPMIIEVIKIEKSNTLCTLCGPKS